MDNQRTITSISTTTTIVTTVLVEQSSASSASGPSPGLELRVALNTTTVPEGGALTAGISLINTLSKNLTLTPNYASNPEISTWNHIDFICGMSPISGIMGFALYRGHFTPDNISTAENPLALAPNVAIGCAVYPNPIAVVLLPSGNRAVEYLNGSASSQPLGIGRAELNATTEYCIAEGGGGSLCGLVTTALFGYWDPSMPNVDTTNATLASQHFHRFSPGQYTLLVNDLWSQTVFAYFSVA